MVQASYNDGGYKSFELYAATEIYRRVKLRSDGTISKAGPTDVSIGTTKQTGAAAEVVAVALANKPGTFKGVMNGACAVGDTVYGAADGKHGTAATGRRAGIALQAASADGDIIEILALEGLGIGDGLSSFELFNDFFHYTTAEDFTSILTDSGTAAHSDAAGGVLVITASDGSSPDNDEAYVKSTVKAFLFAAGKPLVFETRVKWTEADTDKANVIAGLMSAAAANALQDDGAGPAASYSGIVFYKVDGGSTWAAEASIGGTQTAIALTNIPAAPGAGNYQKLRIEVIPTSSTSATAYLYIDDVLVGEQAFTYTGATEMNTIVGVKAGSANNESISVDYIYAGQVR